MTGDSDKSDRATAASQSNPLAGSSKAGIPSARKIEALLFAFSKSRFTVDECERLAKDLSAYNTMTFDLVGPRGRLSARWLDAYFGLLQIDGHDGRMRSADFAYVSDVYCENLHWQNHPHGE